MLVLAVVRVWQNHDLDIAPIVKLREKALTIVQSVVLLYQNHVQSFVPQNAGEMLGEKLDYFGGNEVESDIELRCNGKEEK